jgi:hypothetical protein
MPIIYYNYSYYHKRNPDLIKDCLNEPDFSTVPYIVWYEAWEDRPIYYMESFASCDVVCAIQFAVRLNCPLDAGSGDYYFTIPGVGQINITLDICFNEGTDYGLSCASVPPACKKTSAFMAPPGYALADPPADPPSSSGLSQVDKVGISFGVIGGVMLIVIAILSFWIAYLRGLLNNSKENAYI